MQFTSYSYNVAAIIFTGLVVLLTSIGYIQLQIDNNNNTHLNELENKSNTGLTWCLYNLLRCIVVLPDFYRQLTRCYGHVIKQKRRPMAQSITRLGQRP